VFAEDYPTKIIADADYPSSPGLKVTAKFYNFKAPQEDFRRRVL